MHGHIQLDEGDFDEISHRKKCSRKNKNKKQSHGQCVVSALCDTIVFSLLLVIFSPDIFRERYCRSAVDVTNAPLTIIDYVVLTTFDMGTLRRTS